MIKISYFNYKVTALLSTLVITSGLAFTANATHSLSGFHITVKENNNNDIKLANTWNAINDKYEQLLQYNQNKLINVEFNQWEQITNSKQTPSSDDVISTAVAAAFQAQINDKSNTFMPNDGKQYFDNTIIGRSFANENFDLQIPSFGSVYLNYNDQLPSSINNGLFATINPQSTFTNYFSVPYTLQPSQTILNQSLAERLKIIPIGNSTIKKENENELVIFARKDKEKLVITSDSNNIEPVTNGNLSYAIITHNLNDKFDPTKFSIDVQDESTDEVVHRDVTISNNTSHLTFKNNNVTAARQYLVQNIAGNDNLIVMNYDQGNTIVNISNDEKWTYASVDPKTLDIISSTTKTIKNGAILTASSSPSGIQIYYLTLNSQDKTQNQASGQYITIYNQNQIPTFNNCTNLLDEDNVTLQGFQQYLNSTSNLQVNDLKTNPSSLVTQFITYQGAIAEHDYINYLTNNSEESSPFDIKIKPFSKTLVNNWNIIILAMIFFSILIILPFVILLLRKRKRLK